MPSDTHKKQDFSPSQGGGETGVALDTRVTDWFAFGHYGFTHYRIWQQLDRRTLFQRHEWRREDGSVQLDDWIIGGQDWLPHAERVAGMSAVSEERWGLETDGDTGLYIVTDAEGEFARVTAIRNDHSRARLIAAAPDLLGAMREIVQIAEDEGAAGVFEMESIAAKAIAKAEGRDHG